MLSFLKLLGSGETLMIPLQGSSYEAFNDELRSPKNLTGLNKWSILETREKTTTLRLNAFHKYGFPPRIDVSHYSDQEIRVRIYQTDLIKAVMLFWLFLCVLGYSAIGIVSLNEFTHGDGLLTITEDGVQSEVSFFLWVPIFTLIHFFAFFLTPARALSKGLTDSKKIFARLLS